MPESKGVYSHLAHEIERYNRPMKYSMTIAGIIGAIALPLIGDLGFSEACSQEIAGIGIPYFLSLPGLVLAYVGRLRQGDVTPGGFIK